ncbi:Orotate phosphoribosyltransferase [invertebrate metagenome]|uniref:orotate phosphoribosyltransferase n=1 Tax=invertebrate metagenome TaxID=1711999 RepID=A0A2H9TAC6_9ZZZZ
MNQNQEAFIRFALQQQVIRFGDFTLKSGRHSPYFFNAGLFNTGHAMNKLGQFYAQALMEAKVPFDLLLGPAYKGIPLATATSIALDTKHQQNSPWCFNRKEAKDHGEGGQFVGAPLKGKTVIIDDVITAGTAIREIISLLENTDAIPAAILIAMDRQEKGRGELSAIQEIERDFNIPVISIIKLEQLLEYVRTNNDFMQYAQAIEQYRNQYGI